MNIKWFREQFDKDGLESLDANNVLDLLMAFESLRDSVANYAEKKGEAWRLGEGCELMETLNSTDHRDGRLK